MKYCLAHLMADLSFAPANCLDVLLIQNDAVRTEGEVKHTLLCGGHTLEDPEEQAAWLRGVDGFWGITSPPLLWSILD